MFVIAVLIHTVCASVPAAELNVIVLSGVTVIVPVAFTLPQPPVSGMLYVYGLPAALVGVPLMVITPPDHTAVIPGGNPVGTPIPVAPVVVSVIAGDKA